MEELSTISIKYGTLQIRREGGEGMGHFENEFLSMVGLVLNGVVCHGIETRVKVS